MRKGLAIAALLATAIPAGVAAPAHAADIVAIGRCSININDRVLSQGRVCTQMILREDAANGRAELIMDFPDGFHLEIGGKALAIGVDSWSLRPDRVVYANPGQTSPTVLADEAAPSQFRGTCSLTKSPTGETLLAVNCHLRSPIGIIDVKYRPARS